VPAASSWGPAYPAGLRSRGGSVGADSLARSTRAGTTYLHLVTVPGEGVGSDDAVVYARSSSLGAAWTQRRRVSPAAQSTPTVTAVIAAAGKHVYVAWASQSRRSLSVYVRANNRIGRAGAWTPSRRIGSASGHCCGDTLSIAAAGSSVYVTAVRNGRVILWSSRDAGRTWGQQRLGVTDPDEWTGRAPVAADGRDVIVGWTHGQTGGRVRISHDRGAHWSTTRSVGVAHGQASSVDVLDGRFAIAGDMDSDYGRTMWVAVRTSGWGLAHAVPGGGFRPHVALRDVAKVGLAYIDARPPEWVGGYRYAILWRTSWTGDDWGSPVEVRSTPTFVGEVPWLTFSMLWRSTGAVHIASTLSPPPDYIGDTELRSYV
jgi:hypothetical protein